jgi:hypothetical protein
MITREKRTLADDTPTIEEETPDFDPTRTDQMDELTLSTGHATTGVIEHDERGQARWVWTPETLPSSDADATFDELRALTNDRLAIDDAPAEEPKPSPQSGYDPYDTNIMPQPSRKRR